MLSDKVRITIEHPSGSEHVYHHHGMKDRNDLRYAVQTAVDDALSDVEDPSDDAGVVYLIKHSDDHVARHTRFDGLGLSCVGTAASATALAIHDVRGATIEGVTVRLTGDTPAPEPFTVVEFVNTQPMDHLRGRVFYLDFAHAEDLNRLMEATESGEAVDDRPFHGSNEPF